MFFPKCIRIFCAPGAVLVAEQPEATVHWWASHVYKQKQLKCNLQPRVTVPPKSHSYHSNPLSLQLLTYTTTDAKLLLANYHFVIVPVLNPDGYEYTHTTVS